jgi:hypothetical protein
MKLFIFLVYVTATQPISLLDRFTEIFVYITSRTVPLTTCVAQRPMEADCTCTSNKLKDRLVSLTEPMAW